jgi:hypothetical protein
MLTCSVAIHACLEHSNFLTVNEQPSRRNRPIKASRDPVANFTAPGRADRNDLLAADRRIRRTQVQLRAF